MAKLTNGQWKLLENALGQTEALIGTGRYGKGCGLPETTKAEIRLYVKTWILAPLVELANDSGREGHVRCRGSRNCPAPVHTHGCFNDHGNCDSPLQHVSGAIKPPRSGRDAEG